MSFVARLLVSWGISVAGLWVANRLFGGVQIHGLGAYLVGAAVLGVANAVIRPVLTVVTLPLIVLTLGLFLLVINIAMVALAAWITPDFSVQGFWTFVGTVLVLWLVNWAGNSLVDEAAPKRGRR